MLRRPLPEDYRPTAKIRSASRTCSDTSPPIIASTAATSAGYSTYGDPRLRRYSISIKKNFEL
jgi:hypothetical protein